MIVSTRLETEAQTKISITSEMNLRTLNFHVNHVECIEEGPSSSSFSQKHGLRSSQDKFLLIIFSNKNLLNKQGKRVEKRPEWAERSKTH